MQRSFEVMEDTPFNASRGIRRYESKRVSQSTPMSLWKRAKYILGYGTSAITSSHVFAVLVVVAGIIFCEYKYQLHPSSLPDDDTLGDLVQSMVRNKTIEELKRINNVEEEATRSIQHLEQMNMKKLEHMNGLIRTLQTEIRLIRQDYAELEAMMASNVREEKECQKKEVDHSMRDRGSSQTEEELEPVNYIDRIAGAAVIYDRTSFPIAETVFDQLWYIAGAFYPLKQMNAITVRPLLMPGDSFCFRGSSGQLAVRLIRSAYAREIVYTHIIWDARTGIVLTAPKTYAVKGCSDTDVMDCVTIARCTFGDVDGESKYEKSAKIIGATRQKCSVMKDYHSLLLQSVIFEVEENYGADYTCVYLFQLFGTDDRGLE